MKALTIKQPWASLICTPREDNPLLGIKDIENRTWRTHFRGRVYVHASAKSAKEPYKIFTNEQASVFIDSNLDFKMLESYKQNSQIIGEVDIVDCVQDHSSIWAEKAPKDDPENFMFYAPIWNWVLANPVLYDKPILNVKGKLSFWDPDLQKCESCELPFDPDTMLEDGDSNWFCKPCYDELSPIWQQEYRELVEKGEIEP